MLGNLMLSSPYTDLIIRADGKEFPVLRAVMCAQSAVFEVQCGGPWQESAKRVIEVVGHGSEAVERMIHFMYTGDYDSLTGGIRPSPISSTDSLTKMPTDLSALWGGDCVNLFLHTRVHAIGDYYNVHDLKDLAIEKLVVSLSEVQDKSAHLLGLVKEVYASTHENHPLLRQIVVGYLAGFAESFVDQIDVAAGDMDDLANDLIREIVKQRETNISISNRNVGRMHKELEQAKKRQEALLAAAKKKDAEQLAAAKKKDADHLAVVQKKDADHLAVVKKRMLIILRR